LYWNCYKWHKFYYLSREKRTTEVDAIYLNKRAMKCHQYSWWQWNVGIKKVTFVFSLPYCLAVHICCHCQCHKCTLHTISKVCIHETRNLLLASVLKPGVNLPEDSCTHFWQPIFKHHNMTMSHFEISHKICYL
jgi:hypothetical protein